MGLAFDDAAVWAKDGARAKQKADATVKLQANMQLTATTEHVKMDCARRPKQPATTSRLRHQSARCSKPAAARSRLGPQWGSAGRQNIKQCAGSTSKPHRSPPTRRAAAEDRTYSRKAYRG